MTINPASCDKTFFDDSFINNSKLSGYFYSISFIGSDIINSDFYYSELFQCDFSGANISTNTLFMDSRIEGCSFGGALMENIRIWLCEIISSNLDGTLLKNVYFEGSKISSSSIRSGGYFPVSIDLLNKFYRDRTLLVKHLKYKDSSLSETIYFGLLLKEIITEFKNRNYTNPLRYTIKYEALKNQTESKPNDFEIGKISDKLTNKIITCIDEAENKCNGWRSNRNIKN